ncbi:uncharacterized protein KGF55_005009 [Candida pseudojiufengensis]|uniref:uncharacterized protein n=1 Tax=Candida pseudojiufengensis TaxID=497109 RepID=UPI002224D0DF|nr:uncharacterized protein KGF55_005009 [Candida pseudojiufengensis]KAI5959777.1 hypothetical protein KGF55_005009 [Candida pseudojiufengensis]
MAKSIDSKSNYTLSVTSTEKQQPISENEIEPQISKQTSKDKSLLEKLSLTDFDLEKSQNAKNPFLDSKVAQYYTELYDRTKYECRSHFDPHFTWSEQEEKKVIKILNVRVALAACLMFVALQIDRGNIQQAVTDNMLGDLGLNTNDYNLGNTLFYVSFLVAEIPSQMISKRLGPDIFIPIQICAWSIVAMSQAAMHNKTGFYITRCLIGAIEGGFIADLVLWLSYFFTSAELPIRLSWFWTTLTVTQICIALLAFGILRLRGVFGWAGWQHLFLWEGLITFLIGVFAFYMMVPSAVQTKNWLHPKGWFTEGQEKIVVNRILRDDPTKGSMHNRQAISFKSLWSCFSDYDLWPLYAIGLIAYIGQMTFGSYFALLTRELGFGTFDTNLLTIPSAVLHCLTLIGITWLSEKLNDRAYVALISPIYCSILLAAIRFWPGAGIEVWPSYILNTIYTGHPFLHAIVVSWVSRNSNSVRTRSICSALYNMFVQLDAIIAQNIFREDDRPLYKRGLLQLFCIALTVIPVLLLTKFYYKWRNASKAKIWDAMSEEEQDQYRRTTKDRGNKRLDFRFAH